MMKRYLKNDVLKDRAKYYLDGHYGTMILGFFFFITLLMCFSIMLTSAELAVQDTFGKTGAAMTLFRWLGNFATQLRICVCLPEARLQAAPPVHGSVLRFSGRVLPPHRCHHLRQARDQ